MKIDRVHRVIAAFVSVALCLPALARGQKRIVRVDEAPLAINCSGEPSSSPTVVLMPGGGEPAKNWAKVQGLVAPFAHVCSYDWPGSGDSDKTAKPQSADEMVDGVRGLLAATGERKPFILVAHSLSGIIARRFATRFPDEVAAFVFVDSSNEEQAWRLHEIDPGGSFAADVIARQGFFFITPGQRLSWRTTRPLVVLAHGKPFPRTGQLTAEQFAQWDEIWSAMQKDLATHSPKGEYRRAANSGHFINLDEPQLVVQAIRDVLSKIDGAPICSPKCDC